MIDGEKHNDKDVVKSLLESDDYSYFKNIKFTFKDESKTNTAYYVQAKQKEEEMYSSYYLQNLKNKFDKLEINYEQIFNFFTKIMKKQQFATDYMAMFNSKV